MSDVKTKKNDASVLAFLEAIEHPIRKENSLTLYNMMTRITNIQPSMWGDTIVGYDSYHYVYSSGREGDWPMIGFSPRKQNLSIYIMPGFGIMEDLLPLLGKHKTSKACLYINKLTDIDIKVLEEIIEITINYMRNKYN